MGKNFEGRRIDLFMRVHFKHLKKRAVIKKWGSIVLGGCVMLGVVFCSPPKAFAASVLSPASATRFHVIDISHWNSVDWASLPVGGADGLTAVYMKATQGTTYKDPQMASEVAGAVSRGLPYGFYQYFEPNNDQGIVAQAATFFYSTIKNYGYSCIPVLDVEETENLSDAAIVRSIHTFLDTFKKLSGLDMMIYACPSFINEHFENDTSLAKYRLWLADYGGSYFYPETPHTTGSVSFHNVEIWSRWDMWQYTAELTISGSDDVVDGNWATPSIFINTPSALSCIDSPRSTGSYANSVAISGWEVARSGVSRVDFYLDDFKWLGSTNNLYARDDVQKAVNQSGYYLDPSKCGFSYTFSAETLPNGPHTLYAAAIANDGSVKWDSRTFYKGDGAITTIDSPQQTTYYGNVTVSGWMLNCSGQQRVDYYIDNFKWVGSNNGNFLPRTDVQSIVNANNQCSPDGVNSGYAVTLPTASLTPGTHTIWVAGIGKDGNVKWNSRSFKVADSQMCVDAPSGTVSGNVNVSGWALEHAGIQRVDVYLDLGSKSQKFYSTSQALPRMDVHNVVDPSGRYANSTNSGYSLTIPSSDLSSGSHTVNVAAIGKDGSVQWIVRSFSYQK